MTGILFFIQNIIRYYQHLKKNIRYAFNMYYSQFDNAMGTVS